MSRLRVPLAFAALAIVSLAMGAGLAAAQGASTRLLFATLNGRNEIGQDGERGAGDRNGFGAFTALREGNQLCYAYATRNILTPVAAGVFGGRSTANGPLVFDVLLPLHGDPGAAALCEPVLGAQLEPIFSDPSGYYVDLAPRAFRPDGSGGAIRGQLGGKRTGGPSTGALVATMRGAKGGDKDGFGSFVAIRDDSRSLCFGMTVAKIGRPRSARIHAGTAGTNGTIVVRLRPPPRGDPGARAECITVDPKILRALFTKPASYSVEVTTAGFKRGAVRGRLALSG